jgi:hypothetical protein
MCGTRALTLSVQSSLLNSLRHLLNIVFITMIRPRRPGLAMGYSAPRNGRFEFVARNAAALRINLPTLGHSTFADKRDGNLSIVSVRALASETNKGVEMPYDGKNYVLQCNPTYSSDKKVEIGRDCKGTVDGQLLISVEFIFK